MKAKPFRNYDDKYSVVLKFDKREDAMKFIEAWNEVANFETSLRGRHER